MRRSDETHFITPQGVAGIILRKMRDVAELSLGVPIAKAVVTVPAYFDNAQKQATREACSIANLDIKTIINEPTAAALLYHLEAVKRGLIAPGVHRSVACRFYVLPAERLESQGPAECRGSIHLQGACSAPRRPACSTLCQCSAPQHVPHTPIPAPHRGFCA